MMTTATETKKRGGKRAGSGRKAIRVKPRTKSFYLDGAVIDEIATEAKRQGVSESTLIQTVWNARNQPRVINEG
jgi:hypothetical protein